MSKPNQRLRIEEIDWPGVFPWLALFRSFRMAVHPPKLLLSLLLVLLLYLGGMVADAVWGVQVYPDEMRQYVTQPRADFERWRADSDYRVESQLRQAMRWSVDVGGPDLRQIDGPDRFGRLRGLIDAHYRQQFELLQAVDNKPHEVEALHKERRQRLRELAALEPGGVFETALRAEVQAFEHLIAAATSLNFGLRELVGDGDAPSDTVAGALRVMLFDVPHWVFDVHRGFFLGYLLYSLLLWSLLGGALARMNALHACTGSAGDAGEALRFAFRRWVWLTLAPLMPLILVGVIGLLLTLGGLVFFNIPVLDVLGGVIFGLALLQGGLMALLLIGTAAGVSLMQPAIAVEGTDAFDAVSRSFNYVLGRPWRWAFYTLVALVHGAICYLFMGGIIFLTILVTAGFVRLGVWDGGNSLGANRFDAILPLPDFGRLAYWPDLALLGMSGKVAAIVVWLWVTACVGLLAAFAIAYFQAATTWVYLLLRRAADGTEFDEVYIKPAVALESAATASDEKVSEAAGK